jgi:hypothetical protein
MVSNFEHSGDVRFESGRSHFDELVVSILTCDRLSVTTVACVCWYSYFLSINGKKIILTMGMFKDTPEKLGHIEIG